MLNESNLVLLAALVLAVLLAAGSAGLWVGRRRARQEGEQGLTQVSVVQGAMLGLLGLLLGFTFSMAVSRYDARKGLVIDEANSIETAYLRAQVLPQPLRAESQELFKEYIAIRVRSSQSALDDVQQAAFESSAATVFNHLWAKAMAAVERDIHGDALTSYVEALNAMNDVRAGRNAALENHVPPSVLYLLVVIAALSVAYLGYGFGLTRQRGKLTIATLSIAITLVIAVIIDIDRPRRGLVQISQQSLLELQKHISGR